MTDTIRDLISNKTIENKTTFVDIERRLGLPDGFVYDIADENIPLDIAGILRVGEDIKIPKSLWIERITAAACRMPIEQAVDSIQWKLWKYLLENNKKVEDIIEKYKISKPAFIAFAHHGSLSGVLSKSKIIDDIGIDRKSEEFIKAAGLPVISQELKSFMERFCSPDNGKVSGYKRLVRSCAITSPVAKLIFNGYAPRRFQSEICFKISSGLNVPHEEMAILLADAQDPNGKKESIRYYLSHWMYSKRKSVEYLSKKLKSSPTVINKILKGGNIHESILESLRDIIGIDKSRWDRAVRRESPRRFLASSIFSSIKDKIKPLPDLITEAAAKENLSPFEWAVKNKIGKFRISNILRQGNVPQRISVRIPLCRALGIDRVTFDASCRLMAAHPKKMIPALIGVIPSCQAQESLIKIMETNNQTILAISGITGIPRNDLSMLIRHGVLLRPKLHQKALGQFLGMDEEEIEEALKKDEKEPEDTESVSDDIETRILSMIRKMTPEQQSQMIEQARKILIS